MEEQRFYILGARKLTGEITGEESRELDLIFIRNPLYRDIYKDLSENMPGRDQNHLINETTALHNLQAKLRIADPSYSALQAMANENLLAGPKRNYITRNSAGIMLCFIALLLIGAIFYAENHNNVPRPAQNSTNNISTRPGSKTQVNLPDGSIVILNADSKLTYPDNFLGETREVTLEGEAFFDVAKNKDKPFIIHSKAMDIKVVGTVFNVKAYPAEGVSEAALISGSIEVLIKNRTDEMIRLKPNEKITVSANPPVSQASTLARVKNKETQPLISIEKLKIDHTDNQANEIAWTQNKLVFQNESFEKIGFMMERWYAVKISIEDPALKRISFTGRFYNESINQVLKALQLTHRFKYSNSNGHIIIY